MKIIKITFFLIITVLIIGVLSRNELAKHMATSYAKRNLGMQMHIDSLRIGLFDRAIEVKGVKILNPAGFIAADALAINRLYLKYNLASLFSDKIKIPVLSLDIDKVLIVRNEEGDINLKKIVTEIQSKSGGKKAHVAKAEGNNENRDNEQKQKEKARLVSKSKKPQKQFLIKDLTVHFGHAEFVQMADESKNNYVQDIVIDETKTYKNVDSLTSIVNQILQEIITKQAVKGVNVLIEKSAKEYNISEKQIEKAGNVLKKIIKSEQIERK